LEEKNEMKEVREERENDGRGVFYRLNKPKRYIAQLQCKDVI
jgi:hypothetical protein